MPSLKVLDGDTSTNGAPTVIGDGFETNELKVGGNVPDSCALTVVSTAGTGTVSCTLKLWGWSAAHADWMPMGTHATAASKGLLNGGVAIPEGPVADKITHWEALGPIGHALRVYVEITAISGTGTALDAYIECEDRIDGA